MAWEKQRRLRILKFEALLERCRDRVIALNKDKLKLRVTLVKFMGHVLTANGLEHDPDKVKPPKRCQDPRTLRTRND